MGIYIVLLIMVVGCDSIVMFELFVFFCELQFVNEVMDVSCFNELDGVVVFEVFVGILLYIFIWQVLLGGLFNGNGIFDGNNFEEVIG